MSQPFTFQAANNRSPLRIGQLIYTVLALLAFACGSLLLSLGWSGVGVTITGKLPEAAVEGRAFPADTGPAILASSRPASNGAQGAPPGSPPAQGVHRSGWAGRHG